MSDHEEEFDFDQAGSGASLTYPKVEFWKISISFESYQN